MDLRDDRFEKNAMVSSLDALFDWARHSSLWWLQIRLAYCCGMEMIAAQMSRFNKSERFDNLQHSSPRRADFKIVPSLRRHLPMRHCRERYGGIDTEA